MTKRVSKKAKEAMETAKETITKYENAHIKNHIDLLTDILEAKTPHDLMVAKRDLLVNRVVSMPFAINACYFCLRYHDQTKGCQKCPYGKVHGCCIQKKSDFNKISEKADELLDLITYMYYNGDELK